MHADLNKIIDDEAKNSIQKNTEIKELQYIRLVCKTSAEIPQPPIKDHSDDIWNNAVFLCTQKNVFNKF